SPPRSSSSRPAAPPACGPPARARARAAPAIRHRLPPRPCSGTSDPCPDYEVSPASPSGSVRLQRQSCHYDPRWACSRGMPASCVSDGSSVQTQTYRMHAHRPMESTDRTRSENKAHRPQRAELLGIQDRAALDDLQHAVLAAQLVAVAADELLV